MRVTVCLLSLLALTGGCKKKKAPPDDKAKADTPAERFVSSPGAVSTGSTTPKCEKFSEPDSAASRTAITLIAAAAKAGDLGPVACFLSDDMKTRLGQNPGLLPVDGAQALAEKGSYMPWNIEQFRSSPPHWATKLPKQAAACQTLVKDSSAVYFCKLGDSYELVQVENVGAAPAGDAGTH